MISLAQTIKDIKNNITNILNIMAPKTYVDKKVADLVNGAPAQLDTLQELSKALNNDKDFATTVNNSIAKKLNIAGGTITGNLTVNGTLTGKASTAGVADRALKADVCTGNAASASSVAWSGITDKPSSYTPSAHNHDSAYPSTTGVRASGTWGINITGSAGGVAWANVSGKPTSFTPASHGHGWGEISDKPAQATRWPTWGEVSGKPTSFTPAAHSHGWDSITNKPSTFTPSGHGHGWSDISGAPATATRWPAWNEVTGKPSTFTPSGHSHGWGEITGKPSTFAPSSHGHGWGEISGKPGSIVVVESWDAATGVLKLKTV